MHQEFIHNFSPLTDHFHQKSRITLSTDNQIIAVMGNRAINLIRFIRKISQGATVSIPVKRACHSVGYVPGDSRTCRLQATRIILSISY